MSSFLQQSACLRPLVLLVGCAAAVASTPTHAAEPNALKLSPGILLDSQFTRAFFTDPAGFTSAVSLEDGRSLWLSGERAAPLALSGDRLLALGSLPTFGLGVILVLDPNTGNTVDRIAFDLPEGVDADVSPKPQREFTISAVPGAGGTRFYWHYQARPLRGAMLEDQAEPETVLHGAFDLRFNGNRGYLEALRGESREPRPESIEVGPQEHVANLAGRQFRAANGAHVLGSESLEDPVFGIVNRWTIVERAQERTLGSLTSPYAYAPFAVSGKTLWYRAQPISYRAESGEWIEQAARLVAYDLKNSREKWSVNVLDTVFRGAMPP